MSENPKASSSNLPVPLSAFIGRELRQAIGAASPGAWKNLQKRMASNPIFNELRSFLEPRPPYALL